MNTNNKRGYEPSGRLDEMTLRHALAEAVGAASVAWKPNGEFDMEFASSIIDSLEEYIGVNYTLNKQPDPQEAMHP